MEQQLWILVLVMAVMMLALRWQHSRRKRAWQPKAPGTPKVRVEGYRMTAFVHPRMGDDCLRDHGLLYGQGFRRKIGPALPHDDLCRCTAQPFIYNPGQLLQGALRQEVTVESTLPGLDAQAAGQLIRQLKSLLDQAPPPNLEAYLTTMALDTYPEALRQNLANFLAERYAHLQHRGYSKPPTAPPANITPSPSRESTA